MPRSLAGILGDASVLRPATMVTTDVLDLLEDVKDGFDTLAEAFKHVAQQTGNNPDAVRVAYYRFRRDPPSGHALSKLTAEQEVILVGVAQAFSLNNVPLSIAQMQQLVQRKFGVKVSRMWVPRFVRRHRSELSKRACKALADKRAGPGVFAGVVQFCEELQDFLKHYHFPDHAVFNFDETRVVQRAGNMTLQRVEASVKQRANVRSTRHNTVATLLPFVSANGGVLLSVYILKARFGESSNAAVNFVMEKAPSRTRGSWPRFYCWNDTGYLDTETFKVVLSKFAEEWFTRNPGIPALLFGDQLAAHRRADTVEFALGLGLYLFSLPKNSSHFLQPLDASPFGTLQADKTHRNEAAMMDAILTNTSTRDTLLLSAYEAERRAFNPAAIRGAFAQCGVWPFDAEKMQVNARFNLGLLDAWETPVEAARNAAAEVIQAAQERVDGKAEGVIGGRAVVQRGELHSPFSLVNKDRLMMEEAAKEQADKELKRSERARKKVEKERARADKVAARELLRCRVCTNKVHRGGKAWAGCVCNAFWVCPTCSKLLQAALLIAEHVKECPGPDMGGGESDSEGSAGSSTSDSTE